jgi:hypothetical protein
MSEDVVSVAGIYTDENERQDNDNMFLCRCSCIWSAWQINGQD